MTFIIAEAGVNHNGDMNLAMDLVRAAKESGADAVKFQLFDAEKLEPPGERREMLRRLELSRKDIGILRAEALGLGIEFLCTPFDIDSLRFLAEIGCKKVKIGSGNALDMGLVGLARSLFQTVIVSTGMMSEDDVSKFSFHPPNVVFMQCTSAYPCPTDSVNLRAVSDGFSDHTMSTVIPAAAVALGAQIIEKHITLDRGMEGPDHKASLEPHEFAEMVRNIREVEQAMGDGIKRVMPCEEPYVKIRNEREKWRHTSSERADTQGQ